MASTTNTVSHQQNQKAQTDCHSQEKKTVCTDTINCPFFNNTTSGNIELSSLVKKRNLDDLDDSNQSTAIKTSETIKVTKEKLNDKAELFNYDNFFGGKLETKKKDGSYRYFKKVIRHAETFPVVQEQLKNSGVKEMTIWCSNDYLGLGRHPYVQSKVTEAVWKYGVGSGGTRNISGSTPLHDQLEHELARLHKKEAALLFTSCYVANDTTLYTMGKMLPNCHILSDAGNHASMIQGIRNSGVPKTIFKHNDYNHLEDILKKLPVSTPKIVAFESVHSMDGSICDLEKMCDVTHKYGGISFVDEVHAVGLYGQNGGGVGERDDMFHKMDVISGTLGKAFGNIGGYVAGSSQYIDSMRSYGSGFIFTTSLPPSVAAGALAAIELSRSDEGRELRAKHQGFAKSVKARLLQAGLPVMDTTSHIIPVMVGDAKIAGDICDLLLGEYSIYIQSINYPTVARGTERLRIVPNPHHSDEMIDTLINALVEVWNRKGLPLNKN
jgi:5-aminolevulinate synthase